MTRHDSINVALTVVIALATLANVVLVYWQWTTMREAMIAERRAWVTVNGARASTDVNVGNRVGALMSFTNSGATPALDVRVNAAFKIRDTGKPIPRPLEVGRATAVIGANTDMRWTIKPEKALTQEDVDALALGVVAYYCYGSIQYRDIFGQGHETRFCLQWPTGPIDPQLSEREFSPCEGAVSSAD